MLASVGAGCGGGAPERLSRADMVRQAERVCARGLEQAERLRAAAQPGARGAAAAAEVDAVLEALAVQIEGFADLRGPESTDATRTRAVDQLEVASDLLEDLRDEIVARDLTVNEAIQRKQELVGRINRASARANDALVDLGFLSCVGVTGS